jgi:hypothetical protein
MATIDPEAKSHKSIADTPSARHVEPGSNKRPAKITISASVADCTITITIAIIVHRGSSTID